MNIAIYELNAVSGILERRRIISKAKNITYTAKVREVGEFSFDVPLDEIDYIKKGYIVTINREFDGIIRMIQITQNSSSSSCHIEGCCLKGILQQRLIIPPAQEHQVNTLGYDAVKGSSEHCIKHYWNENIVNPTSNYRRIPGVEIGTNKNRGIQNDKYLARYDVLSDVTADIAKAAKLCIKAAVSLSNRNIVLDVYRGRDCTFSQNENPRMLFELERKNVESIDYTDNASDMKNVFYTTKNGAEFEDEALTLTYYRNEDIPCGAERFEQHLTLSADTPVDGAEYEELLRLAVIEMRNYEVSNNISAEVSRYEYIKDYKLGDIVTVRLRNANIQANMEITEISVTFGDASKKVSVTFGDADISPFSRIKRDIKNVKGVL